MLVSLSPQGCAEYQTKTSNLSMVGSTLNARLCSVCKQRRSTSGGRYLQMPGSSRRQFICADHHELKVAA